MFEHDGYSGSLQDTRNLFFAVKLVANGTTQKPFLFLVKGHAIMEGVDGYIEPPNNIFCCDSIMLA